ncbi:MAG: NAD(P)-dependent oxidoreductase, partial [Alistipes sp.]|nr:NAD(P)-dependent oxidoreductase [Alistipes sp.]
MNILVTGANGQLGNAMRLATHESSDRYIFTDVAELDITDAAAVEKMVAENDIRLIVNCAAYTNVEKAEEDREAAERLNVRAVENLARAIKKQDGWLFHISTDYVFGKEPYNMPCREEQQGTPTGVYGETKLRGEQAIRESGCHHIIIRTAWLYSEFGRNFLKTMLELTATRPQ